MTAVNALHVGGAVHAVAAEDTAFAERPAPFMVTIDTNWADPAQDTSAVAWGRSAWVEITKYGYGNVFLTSPGSLMSRLQRTCPTPSVTTWAGSARSRQPTTQTTSFKSTTTSVPDQNPARGSQR
ncbi:MAG: hypothetical protein ACRDQV_02025 [Pseudonocardiaceae bacterium]